MLTRRPRIHEIGRSATWLPVAVLGVFACVAAAGIYFLRPEEPPIEEPSRSKRDVDAERSRAELASVIALQRNDPEFERAAKILGGLRDLQAGTAVAAHAMEEEEKYRERLEAFAEKELDKFRERLLKEYKKQSGNGIKDGILTNVQLKSIFDKMGSQDLRFKIFKNSIIKSVDNGQPVLWALILGIVPESDIPQASGGHARLIIGYNKEKDIIYYTDSWGAGHERKEMHTSSAFFISSAVWELRPY